MKKTLLAMSLVTLIFSTPLGAYDDLDELKTMADYYYALGQSENNYLHGLLMQSPQLTHRDSYRTFKLSELSNHHLVDILKTCVFMREGITTEHLDMAFQNEIGEAFTKDIALSFPTVNETTILVSETQNIARAAVRSPCVFGLEHKGWILLLQGAANGEDEG